MQRYSIPDIVLDRSFDDFVAIAAALCGTSMGAVTLIDRQRQWFKARNSVDLAYTDRDISFCGHAILQPDHILVIEDARDDLRFHDNPLVLADPHIRFYAGAPLLSLDGLPVGTLCVFESTPGRLDPGQLEAFGALSRQVSLLLDVHQQAFESQQLVLKHRLYEERLHKYCAQLEENNADLVEQNRTDPLTGLQNRRALDAAMRSAATDTIGVPRSTAIAVVDIDHFKSVNDLHGHAVGDLVLVELAALLRAHCAGRGLAVRFGGEEFVLVLPDADIGTAEIQCNMLRIAVTQLPLGVPLTVSIGVTAIAPGEGVDQALGRADAALYVAKRTGRNKVVCG